MRLAAGLLVALVTWPGLARADDAAAKVSEINRHLQDLKGKLDPAPRASDVRSAIDVAKKVKAAAEKLKGMKPTGDAEKMAKTYPAIVDRFVKSAEQLVAMMSKVEDIHGLAKTCESAEAALNAAGEKLTQEKNPEADPRPGFEEQVEKTKEKVDAALADARKRATELEKLKQEVLAFTDREGGWQWVKERLHKRSTAIDAEYDKALKAAETACAPLAQGLRNPDVVAVVAKLEKLWEAAATRRSCKLSPLDQVGPKRIEIDGKTLREREAALAKLAAQGSRPSSADTQQVRACGCAKDHAGHAIGKALGGSGHVADRNVFPQDPSTNSGAMNQYEKDLRKILIEYGHLTVTVKFTYDSHWKTRPVSIHYEIKAEAPDNCDDLEDANLKANCVELADFTTSKDFPNPPLANPAADCPGYLP